MPEGKHRALCWHTHARGSLSQARSARAPPVTVPLRSRLESPRSAIVNRTHACTRHGATRRRSKRFRLANQEPVARERSTKTRSAGPRTLRLRAPPAAFRRSRPLPVIHGDRLRAKHHRRRSLSRVTPARSARLEGRAAHASRPPKGLGLASPGRSAKSDRDRQYPRCFPSLATCSTIRAYVQTYRAGRVLSTASHQPVERARCLFRPSSGTAALTGVRQRERGLPCARVSRSFPGQGDGYPPDSSSTLDPLRSRNRIGTGAWHPNRLLHSE